MSFRVTEDQAHSTVHLDGEIDLDRSPEARAALLKAVGLGRTVYVDLGEVRYMDSSGIASLVEALQKSQAAGLDLVLKRVAPSVLKIFQLARLDTVFTIT